MGVEAHTHEFIATAHGPEFGFALSGGIAMDAVRRVFDTDNLRLVGLHSHISSRIFDMDGFELAAHRVLGLLKEIVSEFGVARPRGSTVDLRWGLGISYLHEDDPCRSRMSPNPGRDRRQRVGRRWTANAPWPWNPDGRSPDPAPSPCTSRNHQDVELERRPSGATSRSTAG